MTTISAQIVVLATPEAVWQVLTDIANYRAWHPFVELDCVIEAGNEIEYYLRTDPNKPRVAPVTATITQCDEPIRFSLQFGRRGVCMIDQWYALDEVPNRTRVTQASNFRGLLPLLAMPFVRKRLFGFLDAPVQGLARRLQTIRKHDVTRTTVKPRLPPKGFRGYRR